MMRLLRAWKPAVVVGFALVVLSPACSAQASGRPNVDVRSMLPSASAPDPVAVPMAASGAGLTRNERKAATLKAREEGALKPTGEGTDVGGGAGVASARGVKPRALAVEERTAPMVAARPVEPVEPDRPASATRAALASPKKKSAKSVESKETSVAATQASSSPRRALKPLRAASSA